MLGLTERCQDLFLARPNVSVDSLIDLLSLLSPQFLVTRACCPSLVLQVAFYSVIDVRAFAAHSLSPETVKDDCGGDWMVRRNDDGVVDGCRLQLLPFLSRSANAPYSRESPDRLHL